jgi:exopolysaccharide biosynthesis protein
MGNKVAQIMKTLNCKNAIQLDVNGSTEFIYNSFIKSNPSNGQERKIGS